MSEVETETGVEITVDGKTILARPDELLIDACERDGTYIPRFCYHSRMKPVGMCRMCIVEVDTGRGPALQPSCMLPVTPGMVVETESEVTKKAQDGVLEFLLANHPLDCPVCDKGGECPLQDQAYSYGPGESRMVEMKRHYEKPIPISDLVNLDRERCILCDRCTRFSKEVAGDTLIHFLDRGNQTEVNTFPDHPFASYFSGNTVQICPVGALTAEPYRFKARPWDLDQVESTCTSCSVGCRVVVQASRNEVLRYQGVDIDPVNWSWLCDKGRFDFESIHHPDRLGEPLARTDGGLEPTTWSRALDAAGTAIRQAISDHGPGSVAVLGGSRLTNESAYAWAKLAKGIIGTDNVDCQLGDGLPAEVVLGLPRATIDGACTPGGTVILLGVDPKDELPVLFLRLRHAVVEDGATVIEINTAATGMAELAAHRLTHRPGEAHAVVDALVNATGEAGGVAADAIAAAAAAADAGGPVTVVFGRSNLAESADSTVAAVAALRAAFPSATFLPALRRANVFGALDAGLAPGILPGRIGLDQGRQTFQQHWSTVPSAPGLDAAGIIAAAADQKISVLVLLGADPLADFPDRKSAELALNSARTVIAVDTFLTESSRQADIVLPASGYAETDGTTTNLEGRVSRLSQKVTPPGTARADWMIAAELAFRLRDDLGIDSLDSLFAELCSVASSHTGLTLDTVGVDGIVVPLPPEASESTASAMADIDPDAADAATGAAAADSTEEAQGAEAEATEAQADAEAQTETADEPAEPQPAAEPAASAPAPIAFTVPTPTVPLLDGYRLRLATGRKLYDEGTITAHSNGIAKLAPGAEAHLHPHDFAKLGVADGAIVKIGNRENERGEISVPVRQSAKVARGVVWLAINQPGGHVNTLIDAAKPVTDVRVEAV